MTLDLYELSIRLPTLGALSRMQYNCTVIYKIKPSCDIACIGRNRLLCRRKHCLQLQYLNMLFP
jgi:hypothetical protein